MSMLPGLPKPWVLTALLGVVACMPDQPPREIPPVTWSGEYLDYAPQEGAYSLCAGTLPYMDRYVGLVAGEMGVELEQPLVYVHGSPQGELLRAGVSTFVDQWNVRAKSSHTTLIARNGTFVPFKSEGKGWHECAIPCPLWRCNLTGETKGNPLE